MTTRSNARFLGIFVGSLMLGHSALVQAVELLHFIEAKDYGRVMAQAGGIKITDEGVVYVTSESKATLLKIVDGNISANSLSPDIFKDSDLGGLDVTADGNLVIANLGSGRVGVVSPDLKAITRFSQDGDDPGELDNPKGVAQFAGVIPILRKSGD
ncbi:MAG: hypothetical protein AAF353_08135, partial [Pseudomonadota bacterium]